MLRCRIFRSHRPACPTLPPLQSQRRRRAGRWCSKPAPKSPRSSPTCSTSPATRSRSRPATTPRTRAAAACLHTSTLARCLNVRPPDRLSHNTGDRKLWIHVVMRRLPVCVLSKIGQHCRASDSWIYSWWTGIRLHQMAGTESTQRHDHTIWSQVPEDGR